MGRGEALKASRSEVSRIRSHTSKAPDFAWAQADCSLCGIGFDMAWFSNVQAKAEDFVATNASFQEATSQVFKGLQVNGRISAVHASKAVDVLFDKLAEHLEGMHIPVERPTADQVMALFKESDVDTSKGLDEREFKVGRGTTAACVHGPPSFLLLRFHDGPSASSPPPTPLHAHFPHPQSFYSKVVVYAARRAFGGFTRSYGIGILTCTVGLMAVKKTIRAVPIVGLVAAPFLCERAEGEAG
jgi:hypothetical protein